MKQLNPDKFNAFLNGIGQSFSWRSSYACPCLETHSRSPDHNCDLCHGNGRIWADPVAGKSGIAGQKVQRQWQQFGMYEQGDLVLTIPSDSPLYAIGEFERVTMADSTIPFSRVFHRGQDDNPLWFRVARIDRVFWKGGNEEIVEGGLPGVEADGSLDWSEADPAPAPGQQYSITGREKPEYFCFQDFPQDRAHHGGAALPRRVILRKFELFGNYRG